MESVVPLKVLGVPGMLNRSRFGADCSCPVVETTEQDLLGRVERGLEKLRQAELRRTRRGLKGLTEDQRETLDRFTRDLLRHAVLEQIQEVVRERQQKGVLKEIREMFPVAG